MGRGAIRGWSSVTLVCCAALLAAGAAPASAFTIGPGSGPSFSLKRPGGFELSFELASRTKALLSVSRGKLNNSYLVPARYQDGRLAAGFGPFGRARLEFAPTGRVEKVQPFPFCSGEPARVRRGTFVGSFRFRGEWSFIRVRERRLGGTVTRGERWNCGGEGGKKGKSPPAVDEEGEPTVVLTAACGTRQFSVAGGRSSSEPKPVFPDEAGFNIAIATESERRGGILILRSAFVFGTGDRFVYDRALTAATVSPPAPFSGTGTFSTDSDGATHWGGDLRVELLGSEPSLAGPRFGAVLYRDGASQTEPPYPSHRC